MGPRLRNWSQVGLYTIQAQEMIDAAVALERAGAVGLFLTALSEEAAKLVTNQVGVPTIGIGYILLTSPTTNTY